MQFLITCLSWGIFSSILTSYSCAKSKSLIGGKTTVLWNNLIAESNLGLRGLSDNFFYSEFRPPTSDDKPIQVNISLNSFRVTGINETSGTLKFTVNLVTEYFDERLRFDNDQPTTRFVPVPYFMPLWFPSMKWIQDGKTLKTFTPSQSIMNPSATRYLSPQGQVYNWIPVTAELTTKSNEEDERNKYFSFDIIALKDSIEDVQLRWRSKEPLMSFYSQEVEGEYGTYSVQPKLERCKNLEEFGAFVGEQEFSCLRFTFSLILEKESTVKIQIPRIPYP